MMKKGSDKTKKKGGEEKREQESDERRQIALLNLHLTGNYKAKDKERSCEE